MASISTTATVTLTIEVPAISCWTDDCKIAQIDNASRIEAENNLRRVLDNAKFRYGQIAVHSVTVTMNK